MPFFLKTSGKIPKNYHIWFLSGIQDSNLQPHAPHACALANCANPRSFIKVLILLKQKLTH